MKPALILITLSFLIFSLTTHLPLTFSQDQVRDIYGNPIFPGSRYFLVPAITRASGGGVRLRETGNSTCPVTVLQDFSKDVNGLALKFTIPGISSGIIFTGTALEIAFEEKPECATSSKWVVVVDDFPAEWVGIGGAQDHPGKHVNYGIFTIQKYDVGYKLQFCNTLSHCIDIGKRDDQNGRRLILTYDYDPYQVEFLTVPHH